MRFHLLAVPVAIAALLAASPGSAPAAPTIAAAATPIPVDMPGTASTALFERAIDPNPTLKSFSANATLAAHMTSPIGLRKTLNGKASYTRPTLKIEFENVPGELKQFQELSASASTYVGASSQYTEAPGSDDGTTSNFLLTPKNPQARVKQLTIKVNNASGRISEADWSYKDGSLLTSKPTYATVGGYRIMTQNQLTAKYPHYTVTGTLTLSSVQIGNP